MSIRREFIGQLIAAGPTRTMSGAEGYVVTAEAIREAIDAGLFRGLACFVDHAARPSVRRLVGVWHDVVWHDGTAVDSGRAVGGVGGAAGMAVGRLRVYETDETRPVVALLEQTLAEAEPPDVGISLVFYPRLAADGRTITRIEMIESADVVMFPASVGSRIWGEREIGREGEGGRVGVWRPGGALSSHQSFVSRSPDPGAQGKHGGRGEREIGREGEGGRVGVWRPGEALSSHQSFVSRSPDPGGEEGQGGRGEREQGGTESNASHNQQTTLIPLIGYGPPQAAPAAVMALSQFAPRPVAPALLPAVNAAQTFLSAAGNTHGCCRDGLSRDGLKPVADMPNALKRVATGECGSGSAFQRTWRGSGGFQSAADGCYRDGLSRDGLSRDGLSRDGLSRDGLKPVADMPNALKRVATGECGSGSAFQRTWRGSGGFQSAADTGLQAGSVVFSPRPDAGRNACATGDSGGLKSAAETGGERYQFNIQQAQEAAAMTQQNETTELRRVALVRGEDMPQGEGEKGGKGEGEPDAALDGWLEALRTAAATAVIRSSGLPAAVQDRLGAGSYESADEVYAAVEQARGELAALSEAGVVQLGGRPPRGWSGSAGIQVRDPLDEARGLVGFFFGAADAPTPPPNLRSFADLYVALTGDAYFRGVFDGDRVQFSGATTSTLPNLAVDAMNRVIVQQFAALDHYRWYERITDVAPNDGRLHAMKWITLGGVGNLPTVSEGAAYTELSIADVKETSSFVKRGGYVGITREMIKNGDIMQLQAIPRALAAAAVRTRSAAVAALFTSGSGVGPTLSQDSKALFHADHANLATTALGTDAAAWRAARAECFQQPEVGTAKPLGIYPRFLLVPAELYDTALSILGYGEGMPTAYAPEAQGRGFADPRPIPLVVPDWTDATDWAYVVDPALFPVIQMSYSQSPGGRRHPIPELFAVVSETSGLMFSNDVLPIKVRDEFAVGVNGPRGIGKRNVA